MMIDVTIIHMGIGLFLLTIMLYFLWTLYTENRRYKNIIDHALEKIIEKQVIINAQGLNNESSRRKSSPIDIHSVPQMS